MSIRFNLRTKLFIAFLMLNSIVLVTVGIISSRSSSTALSDLAFSQLESLREVKKTHIARFFAERERNMGALLETVTLFEYSAFEKMRSVQNEKKAQIENYIRKVSTDIDVLSTNVNLEKMKEFELLLDGQGGMKLATLNMFATHYFGDSLTQLIQDYGYDDVLLITDTGNIVYSVKQERDLGQNVLTGPLQESSLSRCFQNALTAVTVQDFAPYPPADNQQTAFIAAPVVSEQLKDTVGVVAFKISKDAINAIVRRREGMGVSGGTYLVGQLDGRVSLRSDQVVKGGMVGDSVMDSEVDKMLSGGGGALVRMGASGNMEIAQYDPLDIPGLQWGMVTAMSLEEAITPSLQDETDDYFTRFLTQYGYTDLFLIHPDGTIFHSVAHRAEYGTNLMTGDYAETGLGQAFRKALESGSFAFGDFSLYPAFDEKPVAFMAQPILKNETIELVVAIQIPIDDINAVMQERSGMGATGETYLVGPDTLMRSDSSVAPDLYSVMASFANPQTSRVDSPASRGALSGDTGNVIATNYIGKTVLSAYAPLDIWDTRWALIAEITADEAFAAARRQAVVMRNVGIVGFLLIVAFSFLVSGYITQPINGLVHIAQRVSEGDLSGGLQGKYAERDEIGILIRAFQDVVTYFREMADIASSIATGDLRHDVVPKSDRDSLGQALHQMTTYLQEMATAATAFSAGDLRREVSPRSEFDALGKAFQNMQVIRNIITQVIDGAGHLGESADTLTQISALLAAGSEQTSHQVHSVSANSQKINQNINSVSTATEEFSASILNISQNLTDVAGMVSSAVDAVNLANDTMTTLESRSEEIGEITKVITSITQQTNLLALNATIEAARAGDIGRGFAVVANEVKELAKETARSTDDITHRIDVIQDSIREAKLSMTRVSNVIHQVHTLSDDITHSVEQQATTTHEISHNIVDVAQGSDEITQSIAEVTIAASQSSEYAGSVQNAARELAALAEQLRQVVGQFSM